MTTQTTQALPTTAVDRKAERTAALELAKAVLDAEENTVEDAIDALEVLYTAFAPRTKPSGGPRARLTMADPNVVKAYFESTGLTRKQLAGAAGVSTSVIATVQNTKVKDDGSFVGDQWSEITFAVKRAMIDQYMIDHADEIAAAHAADVAAAAAKQAEADAKAAKAAAKVTAKAAPTVPVAAATAPAVKAAKAKPVNKASNVAHV